MLAGVARDAAANDAVGRVNELPLRRRSNLLASAGPLPSGCPGGVIRAAGGSAEAVTMSAVRIYFLSSPPFVIRSLCSCSAPSTHFTYSAPVAKAALRAPFCR